MHIQALAVVKVSRICYWKEVPAL